MCFDFLNFFIFGLWRPDSAICISARCDRSMSFLLTSTSHIHSPKNAPFASSAPANQTFPTRAATKIPPPKRTPVREMGTLPYHAWLQPRVNRSSPRHSASRLVATGCRMPRPLPTGMTGMPSRMRRPVRRALMMGPRLWMWIARSPRLSRGRSLVS